MTNCSRPNCAKPTKSRELCESHYRKRLRMGHYGFQDATEVRDRITKLRELGWTWGQIGDAAGVSHAVPYNLMHGRQYRRVLQETRDAILGIPTVPRDSFRGLDATGSRRRVQALAWMGWTCADVAERAGTTGPSLAAQMRPNRNRVSYAMAARIAAVYEELWDQQGPSGIAAGKARSHGFAPPAAWDDDTIDDPNAQPFGVPKRYKTKPDRALVRRVLKGDLEARQQLRPADRRLIVSTLHARGCTDADIVAVSGISRRLVLYIRADLCLPSNDPSQRAVALRPEWEVA